MEFSPHFRHPAHRPSRSDGWRFTLVAISVFTFLAFLVLGCKKSAPPNRDTHGDVAPTPSTSSSPASIGNAISGGGGVTPNAADQPGSLADRLKAVQEGNPEDKPAAILLPAWKPVSAATSSIQIPFVKNLVQDVVITFKYGDMESIRTISDITPTTATLVLKGEVVTKTPPPPATSPVETKQVTGNRTLDLADLATAHHLIHEFHSDTTEHFPGSTAVSFSTEMLNQLRAGQTVSFDYGIDRVAMLNASLGGHPTISEAFTDWKANPMLKCPLVRAEPTDVSIPVLVNDIALELPAIHVKCDLSGEEQSHFYVLDQPSNPIILASQMAPTQDRSQVIKISWPLTPTLSSPMETALASKKPVEIYGIYFDFNSDKLKPESEAVLKQISDILHNNPGWKLNVSGHTDNIGDDAFNLNLSQRRAAAVKDALVTRYKIAPGRLAASGYGASKPIAPNTTFEGRARNRRVELQRQ